MALAVAVSVRPARWAVRALTRISSPRQFQSAAPVSQRAVPTTAWCRHRSVTAELPSQPNKRQTLTSFLLYHLSISDGNTCCNNAVTSDKNRVKIRLDAPKPHLDLTGSRVGRCRMYRTVLIHWGQETESYSANTSFKVIQIPAALS